MLLVERPNVIKTFPPDRADQPFRVSILPRRSRHGRVIPNAHRVKTPFEDFSVNAIPITDEISRRLIPPAGLGELLGDPLRSGIRSDPQQFLRVDVRARMRGIWR